MSDTFPPKPEPVNGALDPGAESLRSPTFIIAVMMLIIGAGTVFGMFRVGSPEITAGIGNLVIGLTLGGVSGYFLGASKHSGPQAVAAGTVTTVSTPAPSTATTTTTSQEPAP